MEGELQEVLFLLKQALVDRGVPLKEHQITLNHVEFIASKLVEKTKALIDLSSVVKRLQEQVEQCRQEVVDVKAEYNVREGK